MNIPLHDCNTKLQTDCVVSSQLRLASPRVWSPLRYKESTNGLFRFA